MNNNILQRAHVIKYFGVHIDDLLNWSAYTKYLTLQIARLSGIFYRICDCIPKETIIALYRSVAFSRIQCRIITWGNKRSYQIFK